MAEDRGSELLHYLAEHRPAPGERLPASQHLARQLGVNIGKLREQLEVSRQLGLVEVRPKTGIRVHPYAFFPGVWLSLRHGLSLDPGLFAQFEELRNHLEASFFVEAVRLLETEDKAHLTGLVAAAWQRLRGDPIQIPHAEHRELHLTIYRRLDNLFLRGLLEAYWEAYEAVGLNVYADYDFLHEVWTYHERMVEQVVQGEYEAAQRTLVEHTALLRKRSRLAQPQAAEATAGNLGVRRQAG